MGKKGGNLLPFPYIHPFIFVQNHIYETGMKEKRLVLQKLWGAASCAGAGAAHKSSSLRADYQSKEGFPHGE